MAGSNRLFKEREVLFRTGDAADCMYLVRKGSLRVYLEKGTDEILLATLTEGSVVGEMAFFDNKPRSACVRAAVPTECTVITKADFEKLLTQVPKWMVSMMQSLVGRLRQTNEKLATLEAQLPTKTDGQAASSPLILPNQRRPYERMTHCIRLILLALAKDGAKNGKEHSIESDAAVKLWQDFFPDEKEFYDKILVLLEETKFILRKKDSRGIPCLVFLNRGVLVNFMEFVCVYSSSLSPLKPFLSPQALEIFSELVEHTCSSGYDNLNISIRSMMAQMKSRGQDTSHWPQSVLELSALPEVKINKSPQDINVRIHAKDHKMVLTHLRTLQIFHNAKMA